MKTDLKIGDRVRYVNVRGNAVNGIVIAVGAQRVKIDTGQKRPIVLFENVRKIES